MGGAAEERPGPPVPDPAAPLAPAPGHRRRRPIGSILSAALLVVLLAGAGLFALLREDPLTFGGRYVTDPAVVLAAADRAFSDHVAMRQGVRSEDSRCWFQLEDAAGSELRPELLCGPALFVDGRDDASWLRFPLTGTPAGGDVRLSVAALPADPAPQPLTDRELLRRPDREEPPRGTGGLTAPAVPQAPPGHTAVGPFPDVTWTEPAGPARLSGPAAAVTVTGLARPDRVGTGDDARRPAEGEEFLAVRYLVEQGEGRSPTPPAISYQVPGREPVVVAPALTAPGATVEALLSVPADAAVADLVVVDAGVEQRLSLLTGAPDPGNLQVLARTSREADVDAVRQLSATLSAPGRVSASLPVTIAVGGGRLEWFVQDERPADPSRALLLLDVTMALPDAAPGAVPTGLLSLRLPDGTTLPALDLDDSPTRVITAFDVPAGFTEGTLVVAGSASFPDGASVDLGTGRASVPVTVPAG
ncbi:hypothetical protein [Modestobacter sp. VKM Ac-2984]|uniref:hypothetical protein n=1 Tax=Modestobacter sp. VKM Ac-2984 TaxID=3004138 RepID=UPI0022AA1292|nr:hypothetical protein [Modestobacter sp. VKM Ac-2984]MCZ2815869.1 hypothetical protein [Modestobacter sp. VKM Ac-2984]